MKGRINLIEPHSGTLSIRAQCSVLGCLQKQFVLQTKRGESWKSGNDVAHGQASDKSSHLRGELDGVFKFKI